MHTAEIKKHETPKEGTKYGYLHYRLPSRLQTRTAKKSVVSLRC